MLEVAIDVFRTLMWSLIEVILFIVDTVWEVILRVATLDFARSVDISSWYGLIILFLVFFIVFRFIKITIKYLFDEDYREKAKISKVILMLCFASLLSGLIPIVFEGFCSISTDAIENIGTFLPAEQQEVKMSTIILEAGKVDLTNPQEEQGTVPTDISDGFDINEKQDGEYRYFSNTSSLILVLFVAFVFVLIFCVVALQIAQRFFTVICKYLFAPYVVASLIDPEDNTFTTWMKMLSGDLMLNWIQIYGMYLIMYLCNSTSIHSALGNDFIAILSRIVMCIGGVFAVMELPSIVASITGGSGRGIMQSIHDMQTLTGMVTAAGYTGKAVTSFAAKSGLKLGVGGLNLAAATGQGTMSALGNMSKEYKSALSSGATPLAAAGVTAGSMVMNSKPVTGAKKVISNAKESVGNAWNNAKATLNGYGSDSSLNSNSSGGINGSTSGQTVYGEAGSGYQDTSSDLTSFNTGSAKSEAIGDSFSSSVNPVSVNDVTPVNSADMNYQLDMSAAKYYGIDNPQQYKPDELKKILRKKGHSVFSTSNKGSNSLSKGSNKLYKVNLNNNRKE